MPKSLLALVSVILDDSDIKGQSSVEQQWLIAYKTISQVMLFVIHCTIGNFPGGVAKWNIDFIEADSSSKSRFFLMVGLKRKNDVRYRF